MIIKELYRDLDLLSDKKYTFIGRSGEEKDEEEDVLKEHLIDVYINEKLTMKLVCIPQYLTELVLGRLMTEGIISCTDDVDSIYVCEYGTKARVMLKHKISEERADYVEVTQTCCTNNHILNDRFVKSADLKPVKPIFWKKEWIFNLADTFAAGMPIHEKTFSTHSALLAIEDRIIFSCEDIGRHNAIDKAVGYALRNNIDLTKCILYSSGRIPTDMTMKAIRARIPVFCSKAAPTGEAIEMAEKYNLTLICAARKDRMKQYVCICK